MIYFIFMPHNEGTRPPLRHDRCPTDFLQPRHQAGDMYPQRRRARALAIAAKETGVGAVWAKWGFSLVVLAMLLALSGCAGALPGGSDSINKSYYDSNADLESWVNSLEVGMSREETFARLGRVEKDFRRLARNEIVGVLFGGEDAGIPVHFYTDENILSYLDSLEGYRIEYKTVKRRHGFTSVIRVQTDAKGFDYRLNLIFKDGKLYQKPFLTGGQVNTTSSKTIFDYMTPGLIIGVAKDSD